MWRLPGVARASPGAAAISLRDQDARRSGLATAIQAEMCSQRCSAKPRLPRRFRCSGWAPPTRRCHGALLADPLVQIPAFGPVNRLPRRNRRSRIALRTRRSRPRRDCQDGHRHRNNHPEDEHESVRFRCHVFLLAPDRCAVADVEVERRDICDARHTSVV